MLVAASSLLLLPPVHVLAAPQGGIIAAGDGSIQVPDSSTTTIQQNSQSLVINWDSFNLAAGESVNFIQPSSSAAALNQIFDQNPSQIFGSINANGRVFLSNPNGLIFGAGSTVNVGALLATSLNISASDFMSGNYQLNSSGGNGAIINQGVIQAASGGSVALIGNSVSNEGVIIADYGQVILASGRQAVLNFDGDGLINFQVDAAVIENSVGASSAVNNSGDIIADGGKILLSAAASADIFDNLVNNEGLLQATRIENHGGVIHLTGNGGRVISSGVIDASSADGIGGEVHLLGSQVGLFDDASVVASGRDGGGVVLIGGDFQGNNPDIENATQTFVGANATIRADAIESGDGGRVIVWADEITRYYGGISAQGGAQSGDGGFVEVSGKQQLDFHGAVSLSAQQGNGGILLLDPDDITLQTTGTTTITDRISPLADVAFAGDITISIASVTGFSELFLQAGIDITLANDLTMGANNSVIFTANNDIILDASLSVSGTGTISLTADADSSGAGDINFNNMASLSSANQSISLAADEILIATGQSINAGNGEVIITTTDNSRTINLGGTATGLDLSNVELNLISAGTLTIGSAVHTGNIEVIGNVSLADVGLLQILNGGQIDVNDNDSLAVSDAGASIALTASGLDSDIIVNSTITAGADGSVTLTADNRIRFAESGDGINAPGTGAVIVRANNDALLGTDADEISMNSGSFIDAGDGSISLDTSGLGGAGILLGALTTTGTVTLTSATSISDNNGGATNVTAATLNATAASGIGSGDALETTVSELNANVTGIGDLSIINTGTVILSDIDTADGTIDISSNLTLTASDVASANNNTITLNAAAITVDRISAGAGNVVLNAATGAIAQANTISATEISAGHLVADANGGIDLDTAINSADLTSTIATANTGIQLDNNGALTLTTVDTVNGSITVTATGLLAATDVASGMDQNISLSGNGVSIGRVNAGAGDLIVAAGSGAITDGSVGGGDTDGLTGGSTGIGSGTGNPDIDIAATSIDASTGSGGIYLDELNGIDIVSLTTATSGDIFLEAGGAITTSGSVTTAGGGSINISNSSGAITLDNAITADGAGTVDIDATGLLTVNAAIGSTTGGLTLTGGTGASFDANGDLATDNFITVNAFANDITMVDGSLFDAGSGLIDLNAAGNAAIAVLSTSGNVNIDATSGAISDVNAAALNVSGAALTATAASGIDLDTTVTSVDVSVTASGPIDINETNALSVTSADTLNGNISLAASDITVIGAIDASGNAITLQADEMTIASTLTATDVSLLRNTSGVISLGTADGVFGLNLDSTELSNLTVTNPLQVGGANTSAITVDLATIYSGNLSLTSSGSISGSGLLTGSLGLTLNAATGIGPLNTVTQALVVNNTTSGNVDITNTTTLAGVLTLSGSSAGDISVTASDSYIDIDNPLSGNTITLNASDRIFQQAAGVISASNLLDVTSGTGSPGISLTTATNQVSAFSAVTNAANASVSLMNNAGASLDVQNISSMGTTTITETGSILVSGPIASGLTITLDATNGSISGSGLISIADTAGSNLTLNANTGIGSSGNALNTAVRTVLFDNTTSGGVYLSNNHADGLATRGLSGGGDIVISEISGNSLSIGTSISSGGGDITLISESLLLISGPPSPRIDAAGGDIRIQPFNDSTRISVGNPDGAGGNELVLADGLLDAMTSMGTLTIGSSTQSGGITLNAPITTASTGDFSLQSAATININDTLTNATDININAGGDISFANNADLTATNGQIFLDAGGAISGLGSIRFVAPLGIIANSPMTFAGNIDIDAATTLTIQNNITSSAGNITLDSGMPITFNAGVVLNAGGDIDIGGAADVDIVANGNLDLIAGGDISLLGAAHTVNGDLLLDSAAMV